MSRFDENTFKESVVSRNSDVSTIDTSIKFKHFERKVVREWEEKEYCSGVTYSSIKREYESITDFMMFIKLWIDDNHVRPVSMFPMNNEKEFVVFYY